MEKRKINKDYYLFGNGMINFDIAKLREFKEFENFPLIESANINKAHGDEVTYHPDIFVNVATSETCKVNSCLTYSLERSFDFSGWENSLLLEPSRVH